MFSKILTWISDWIEKMFGKETLQEAVGVDLSISQPMVEAITLWASMYENSADWLTDDVKSLNLPASIAAEISRMTVLELEIEIEGSKRAEYLAEQFTQVSRALLGQIEYGAAKGGIMMKPYPDGERIIVDFVQADHFFPTRFNGNGNVTGCVFVDQRTIGKYYYTRLEMHNMTKEEGYIITNTAYKSDSAEELGKPCDLAEIDDWAELEEEATIQNIEKPLFSYFRYPLANNIDSTSPLGVSCFSRAVELIEQADNQWSELMWEFESGGRALYVDVLALEAGSSGSSLPSKRLFKTLNTGTTDADLFQEWSPEFRDASIISGLDANLKRIEGLCGLAPGTLSDPNQVALTATEIVSSKQRTYAMVTEVQKATERALEQLLYAMDMWATLSKLSPAGEYETAFKFDDSVINDADIQFSHDMSMVSQGMMSKVEFRMRNMGESEKIATDKIKEITEQMKSEESLFPDDEG